MCPNIADLPCRLRGHFGCRLISDAWVNLRTLVSTCEPFAVEGSHRRRPDQTTNLHFDSQPPATHQEYIKKTSFLCMYSCHSSAADTRTNSASPMDPAKQDTGRSSKRQKRGQIITEPPRFDADAEDHYHPAVSTLRSALSRRMELLAELSSLDATISQARADIKGAGGNVLEPDSLAVIGLDNASAVARFLCVPSLCCFDHVSKAFREIAGRHWIARDAAAVCQSRSRATNPRTRVIMEYRAVRVVDRICTERQILDHTVSEEPDECGFYRPKCRGCEDLCYEYLNVALYVRSDAFEPFLRFVKGDEILLQGFFPATSRDDPNSLKSQLTVSDIPLDSFEWSGAGRLSRIDKHDGKDDGKCDEVENLLRDFGEGLTISIFAVNKLYGGGYDGSAAHDHYANESVHFVMGQNGFKPTSFSGGIYTCASSMWMHWKIHCGYKQWDDSHSLAVSRKNGDELTLFWDAQKKMFSVRTCMRDKSTWIPF